MYRKFYEFDVPDHMHKKVKYNTFAVKPVPTLFSRLWNERQANIRKGRR